MEEPKIAKVPEGITIEQPNKEEKAEGAKTASRSKPQRSGMDIPDFGLDVTLPTIVFPHYTNNAKDMLSCVLIRPDGQSFKEDGIPRDSNHPLFKDIMAQYTEQEIDHNTAREIQNQKAKQADAASKETEAAREKKRADLWARKSTFLDLDVVRNTKYKSLKRKLRQATNPEEALAYGVAIIVKETPTDED